MKIIKLQGEPVSTNSLYRFTCTRGFPRMYMTEKGRSLKEAYWYEAKSQYRKKILEGELEVEIKLFFKNERKHDIDNYHKILFDALSGVVWKDDSQIIKLTTSRKQDKSNPRIEITIYQLFEKEL